jgi:osmotically-inducible protein OsmY
LEREYPKLVQSVEVSVDQGIAHLKGALRNHREIDQVLATTVMQNGVKDVESELTIKGRQYGSSHKRSGKY